MTLKTLEQFYGKARKSITTLPFYGPIVGRYADGTPMQAGALTMGDVSRIQAQAKKEGFTSPRKVAKEWGLSDNQARQVLAMKVSHGS